MCVGSLNNIRAINAIFRALSSNLKIFQKYYIGYAKKKGEMSIIQQKSSRCLALRLQPLGGSLNACSIQDMIEIYLYCSSLKVFVPLSLLSLLQLSLQKTNKKKPQRTSFCSSSSAVCFPDKQQTFYPKLCK